MIRQHVCLHKYDWCIDIIYDARHKDAERITRWLYDMGCPVKHIREAYDLLESGVPNEGLTYSDKKHRHTLVVVGHASDLFGALNTLEHEINHLETHICEYYDIDMHSETAAYLSGDIKEVIARNAWATMRKLFLYLI